MDTKETVRSTIIEMARRRQRTGSGSSPKFLRARTAAILFPDLSSALGDLPWATVGAAAVRHYMPERATRDLDILIAVRDSNEVERRLEAAGFTHTGELAIGGSSWTTQEGFPVDVIQCGAPWCAEALAEVRENRDAQGLPVLPLPYLVLTKFLSGRVQDLADITRILGQAAAEDLDRTRNLFRAYAAEGVAGLESLAVLGRLELEGSADQ